MTHEQLLQLLNPKGPKRATIFSLMTRPVEVSRPGCTPARFVIPASVDGRTPARYVVRSIRERLDDINGPMDRLIGARELARGTCADFQNAKAVGQGAPGVFWMEGDVQPEDIPSDVFRKIWADHVEYLKGELAQADNNYQISRNAGITITPDQRLAAKVLGVTRDWLVPDPPMPDLSKFSQAPQLEAAA